MLGSRKPKKETLNVNGLTIELIRSRRKSLSLEVGSEGIKARAPLRMRRGLILEFIESRSNWLKSKQLERPAPLTKIELSNGAELLYKNAIITLNIKENVRGKASLCGSKLTLPVIKSTLPISETIKSKLIRWYKTAANNELEQRVHYYAPLMDVERPAKEELNVREYKRRWGSCDHKGKLSFNWRIIMAPQRVLDYVVIHELAHCHEFNHSKRFWRLVEKQMPDWKDHHDWLQKNGFLLYRV